MSKWFIETFMPSVFERAGTGKSIWLTAKQTRICIENMEQHATRYDTDGYGDRFYNHLWYTVTWNGREVIMDYSKINGCGSIRFGYTEAESAEADRQNQENRKALELHRVQRHPERYLEKLEKLRQELREIRQWIAENPTEADEIDEEEARILSEEIKDLKKKMEAYCVVAS